ncbi:hypothetical protein Pan44_30460 [Caulifigura coniformis]|uniref:Cytochrome c domain-containing protein n=1 Tax=Caulifigura coniformis TaxID=2527983 RepID=A0A517SFU8_9PLAN|nr:PVC-type heme-binding CxxCH protein [Caulifigura coniformis]QDT55005.1 hypothetical protein Pan44_30460 [Caulifigura coniformis]
MMSKARLLQSGSGVVRERRFASRPGGLAFSAAALLILAQSSAAGLLAADLPRVPPGFTVTRVTTPGMVQHPTMACFDDRGRLYVCESAGTNANAADLLKDPQDKILRLEDTDGDGTFDKSVVFADKLVFPQGVLWHEGAVYTCSSPYLWKLKDNNGDGVCDERTVLVKSFGFSGNAADIHGPFLGPEGRLWWCDGRHGHEIRTDENGLAGGPDNAVDIPARPEPGLPNPEGKLLSQGKAARIFNCNLDGSDVQTFCGGGMDNPVEVDFWDTGEVLGTVNLFYGTPRGDCLVHWVWGGVYPKADQQECIAEFPRTVGLLDEVANYGHVAVSGMCKYRSEQFGKGWNQSVFVTMFNTHKVVRTTLERSGSTFKATGHEDFVVFDDPDSHPTDVLEDADGSLLVVDTGGWFRIGCPASQVAKPQIGGAIYRIRKDGAHQIDDPYGRLIDVANAPIESLLDLTTDPRPNVVRSALARLRKQSLTSNWTRLKGEHRRRYIELEWAGWISKHGLLSREADEVLQEALLGPDLALRRRAIESIVRYEGLTPIDAIRPHFRHRYLAAISASLSSGPVDRAIEHAATFAFARVYAQGSPVGYLSHQNPIVQRVALLAADEFPYAAAKVPELKPEDVIPLLGTSDADLQRTVFDVISRREGWAAGVVDLIAQWLSEPSLSDDRRAIIRRFLAERAGESSVQTLIASQLARADLSADARQTLLEAVVDAKVPAIPSPWVSGLLDALKADGPARRLAIAAALRHKIPDLSPALDALAEDETIPSDLRIAAMDVQNVRDQQPLADARFQFLRTQLDSDADPVLTATAARVLADSPLSRDQLIALAPAFDGDHSLLAPTLLRAYANLKDSAVAMALLNQLNLAGDSLILPGADLARVFSTAPADVQKQAAPLLAAHGLDPAKQAAKLAELTDATKTGNARNGRDVFFSNKALCSRCHRVNNQGETIGPDLSMVGAIRQHHELVEAVVEPSASFVRSYRPVVLATSDGKVHTGVIASETSTEITLRTADFAELRIPRSEVETFKEADLSIMPAGVETRLTQTELADLIAYLASLKERKP